MAILKINLSGHQNEDLTAKGFRFPGSLQVDLSQDDIVDRVVAWLDGNIEVGSGDTVIAALPGLPLLRDVCQAWFHGRTGQFASTVTPIRQPDGTFSFGEPLDLQDLRNRVARSGRPGTVML